MNFDNYEERIRKKAYKHWQFRIKESIPGDELDDWLWAEEEVTIENLAMKDNEQEVWY